MSEQIHIDHLIGCARCDGDGHDDLTFQHLTYPIEIDHGTLMTHWCPCPTNGEPILYGTTPEPMAEAA